MTRRRPLAASIVLAVVLQTSSFLAQTPPVAPEKTPQGIIALAYYKAANAGDVAGLKKVLTDESAQVLDGPNAKTLVEALKGQTPPGPVITNITAEPTVTRVDVEFKQGARVIRDRLKLVLIGTEWKVDMMSR